MFRELPEFLKPGDCLVLNDSKVFPSRLLGRRVGGGRRGSVFVARRSGDGRTWQALVRPGRRMRVGERARFGEVEAEVLTRGEFGERTLRLIMAGTWASCSNASGMCRCRLILNAADAAEDRERYQTVFARRGRIGGCADGGVAFHRRKFWMRAARGGGGRACDAARRTGNVSAAAGGGGGGGEAACGRASSIGGGESSKMREAGRSGDA